MATDEAGAGIDCVKSGLRVPGTLVAAALNDDFDCELDIDILLSLNDDERRAYIKERLKNSPSSEDVQTAFIDTVVDRLRNLALAKEVRPLPT
nr:unnamed protein product [Spirometra erinaceieuropaei]